MVSFKATVAAAALAAFCLLAEPAPVSANPAKTWAQVAGPIQPAQVANSGNGDTLGASIALSKDKKTMVVGSTNYPATGAIFIYTRPSTKSQAWTAVQGPIQITNMNNPLFGYAVAMSDNAKVIAASAFNNDGGIGAVYIYQYSQKIQQWALTQMVLAPEAGAATTSPQFGTSVSLSSSGKLLAIGAPGFTLDTINQTSDGKVWLYKLGSNKQYAFTQALQPPTGPIAGAYYGVALSLSPSGKTLAVGALGVNSSEGRVYVYSWNGKTFLLQTTLTPPTGSIGSSFGLSVSVSGKVLAVGAPSWNQKGALFVYNYAKAGWTLKTGPLLPSNLAALVQNANFGSAMSLDKAGKTLAVSAFTPVTPSFTYIFANVKGTWKQTGGPFSVVTTTEAELGASLALSKDGKYLVAGAPEYNDAGNDDGAVYAFQAQKV